jgi:hypothetical protein
MYAVEIEQVFVFQKRTMDNNTIDHILKNHPDIQHKFGGVFACDQLPTDHGNTEKFYVINTDPSDEPGSHWCCVYKSPIDGLQNDEYFDSYGWFPPQEEFKEFMKNKYTYSCRQLQHDLSTVCGQYCVFYIWQRCKGKTLAEIINLFPFEKHDFLANDLMVNSAVKMAFKIDEQVVDKTFLKQHLMRSVKMQDAQKILQKKDKSRLKQDKLSKYM